MKSILLPVLAIVGCEITGGGSSSSGLSSYSQTVTTANNGLAEIEINISGHRSFLLTAEGSDYVSVEEVYGPNGQRILYWEDWYGNEALTYAIYPLAETVLNWPVRQEDGPLQDGNYTVVVGAYEGQSLYYDGNEPVTFTVHKRIDSDVTAGKVEVVIVYCRGVGNDATAMEGTQAAVSHWTDMYTQQGLELVVRYVESDIDPDLPYPGYGNTSSITQASSYANEGEITVVIGEAIEGDSRSYYGVSGGVPGTLIQSGSAAVVISWLANAGGDGAFSEGDIKLYGETLAHEVGHYTGLFHVVEDGYNAWDALDDTVQCTSRNSCESDLGDNLMFPYSICDWTSCVGQFKLTTDQRAVTQRYTGTR